MSPLVRPLALFALAHLLGCGSSSPRNAPGAAPTVIVSDAGGEDTGTPPVRTMKTATLLAGSPKNLLLDPVFTAGSAEWGHFFVSSGSSTTTATFDRRVFGASPGGIAAPVAILKDPAATDTKSKQFAFMSSFVGGPGPYAVHLWASASNAAGDPVDFPTAAPAFRVTITAALGATGVSYELVRDEASLLRFGDRKWYLFSAKIDATLNGGGFFNIRCGALGGGFQVTLPEVLPTSLVGAGTLSLERAAVARPMDDEEQALAREYQRIPVRLEGAKGETVAPPGAALEARKRYAR